VSVLSQFCHTAGYKVLDLQSKVAYVAKTVKVFDGKFLSKRTRQILPRCPFPNTPTTPFFPGLSGLLLSRPRVQSQDVSRWSCPGSRGRIGLQTRHCGSCSRHSPNLQDLELDASPSFRRALPAGRINAINQCRAVSRRPVAALDVGVCSFLGLNGDIIADTASGASARDVPGRSLFLVMLPLSGLAKLV